MPVALHPDERRDFVLPDDQEAFDVATAAHAQAVSAAEDGAAQPDPPKPPTIFTLRPIAAADMARVEDHLTTIDRDSSEVKAKIGSRDLEILKLGLAGWKNFWFADGREARFLTERLKHTKRVVNVVTDTCLSYLGSSARKDLVKAIEEGAKMSADDLGN